MLTILTSELEIQRAHVLFMSKLIATATPEITQVNLGFKGGSGLHEIEYSETHGIFWFTRTCFEDARGSKFRYFNAFGKIKEEFKGAVTHGAPVSTRVHLNYAASDSERKLSAVFAKNEEGKLFLLHNGNMRLPAGEFWENYKWESHDIQGKRYAEVGEISSDGFVGQLTKFIERVYDLKLGE